MSRNRILLLVILVGSLMACQENRPEDDPDQVETSIEESDTQDQAWMHFTAKDVEGRVTLTANGEEIEVQFADVVLLFPQAEVRKEGSDWRYSSSLIEEDNRHYLELSVTEMPCEDGQGRMGKLELDGAIYRVCIQQLK